MTPDGIITLTTRTAAETEELGRRIGTMLTRGDVIAMTGTLGAGKTTLTKGIARALGIEDTVTSPTFCLISEYEGTMPLYHMDVYRLDGEEDFENLGVEDMLYGNGVCVIEWSEKVARAVPKGAIRLGMEASPDGIRTITIRNWNHGEISG